MAELIVAVGSISIDDYWRLTVGQRAAIIAEHNRVTRKKSKKTK